MSQGSRITDAIDRSARHASPKWCQLALAVVRRIARRQEEFTSADVLQALQKYSDVSTHDLRAVGPIMVQARDAGYIKGIGLVRRNDQHSRGCTVLWRSLILRRP